VAGLVIRAKLLRISSTNNNHYMSPFKSMQRYVLHHFCLCNGVITALTPELGTQTRNAISANYIHVVTSPTLCEFAKLLITPFVSFSFLFPERGQLQIQSLIPMPAFCVQSQAPPPIAVRYARFVILYRSSETEDQGCVGGISVVYGYALRVDGPKDLIGDRVRKEWLKLDVVHKRDSEAGDLGYPQLMAGSNMLHHGNGSRSTEKCSQLCYSRSSTRMRAGSRRRSGGGG
jgi:hypothetical protein